MFAQTISALVADHNTAALKAELANAGEMEILHALQNLDPKSQVVAFRLLSKNQALEAFEALDVDDQQNLLHSFADEDATEYFNAMAPDDRVRALDEMPASVAKRLIGTLSPQEREMTNSLMGYAYETAGRIMTPEFIRLRADQTAEEALAKVRRQASEKETIYTLYVTGPSKDLQGVVSLRNVLLADPSTPISEVMAHQVVSVSTDDDQEKVARLLQELDLLALPVVDKENRIVGIVTVDDAIDILEDEATDDMFDQAGLVDFTGVESSRSEVLVRGSLWAIWKVRLPFLVITLLAGFLAGLVIEGFEETLESVAAVAVFIPLIMDMGGNVGTQSSTVFARGIVLGQIDLRRFWRPFLKEVTVGLSLGVITGVVAGIAAGLWQNLPGLGIAVGLALIVAMTLAALLGFLVPYVLLKLGFDHAAGSAPIITSIKDIAGLIIYFGFVNLFLAHLL